MNKRKNHTHTHENTILRNYEELGMAVFFFPVRMEITHILKEIKLITYEIITYNVLI